VIRARKRFGQHFLESAWVNKVVSAIAPSPDETFIEIGPGRGALSFPLAARARHVVGFEIDRDLASALRAAAPPNLTIVEANFLEVSPVQVRRHLDAADFESGAPLRIAGNLPYNVSSPILFRLAEIIDAGVPVADATVMLQREVAEGLLAQPGSREYGVPAILLGRRATIERLLRLPPGAFRPAPKVYSTVVKLRFHRPQPPAADEWLAATLVRSLFTRRRKMLANALLAFSPAAAIGVAEILRRADVDGRRRPETLDAGELVRLSNVIWAIRHPPRSEG
jgi:16S rRNA (adenine1518-N6/adenine1519-N6)-dimethyltransferase